MVRLEFIGYQEDGLGGHIKLFNVFNSPRPEIHPDGSTISEETAVRLGWMK